MSHLSNDPLFFIAVLPDSGIQEEISAFKKIAADRFNSRHALKSPPHITLIPPFRMGEFSLSRLEHTLLEFAQTEAVFHLELCGFDCFRPRVIFVDVSPNQKLKHLQSSLKEALSGFSEIDSTDSKPFHPHMTVAFKDLSSAAFPDAWAYFSQQQYERSFEVGQLTLLQYQAGQWVVKTKFPLLPGAQLADGKDT